MKVFDITKKEYKNYSKKFKKTYIGKQYFYSSVVLFIFLIVTSGYCAYNISIYNEVYKINNMYSFLFSLILLLIIWIGYCISVIRYEKLLHQFINNK